MIKIIFSLSLILSYNKIFAEDVIRIEVGKDYKHYSDSDLRKRVWELERAVWQLQSKVFQLEMGQAQRPTPAPATWICKMKAMGETYTATGVTKAEAQDLVLKECKKGQSDSFFCKEAICEN